MKCLGNIASPLIFKLIENVKEFGFLGFWVFGVLGFWEFFCFVNF